MSSHEDKINARKVQLPETITSEAAPVVAKVSKPRLAMAIAAGEAGSSCASLGAAWVMEKHEHSLDPAVHFIANHVVMPVMIHTGQAAKCSGTPEEQHDQLEAAANKKATLLVKGGVMTLVGFAVHTPIQLAMGGKFDLHELKQVVLGKGAGVILALVSMGVVQKMCPDIVHQVHNKIDDLLGLPEQPARLDGSPSHSDFSKLVSLELLSSVFSGVVNHGITSLHAR